PVPAPPHPSTLSLHDALPILLSYQFLTENLHISSLTEADAYNLSGVSIGGLENGISVREMTAAYLIFGNGGKYYEPYTIYRIEEDRKSTRLNSSHVSISYAVF